MNTETIEINKDEYRVLLDVKNRYEEIMKYNTIALSNNVVYCRVCNLVSKQADISNRILCNKEHFDK